MSDFKAKMQHIRFRLGLRPRPHWGSLQCSPDPLAGFKGSTSKGREGNWREGRGSEGKGRGGRKGGRGGGKGGKVMGKGKEGRERTTIAFWTNRTLVVGKTSLIDPYFSLTLPKGREGNGREGWKGEGEGGRRRGK